MPQVAVTGEEDEVDSLDPEVWRWIWLVTAVLFGAGEIVIAGSFFLAPFAIGAAVAAILGFLGVSVVIQWVAFVGVSIASFAALRPLARRLDESGPSLGIGSNRQLGQRARVLETIEPDDDGGMVRLGADRWRADAVGDQIIPAGTDVTVVEVRGTRLVVAPVDAADPAVADPPFADGGAPATDA
ncbi:MAG: NfeD family protein [Acidimicrobiales bacterium]|nr:NfeD family protein [Acidimicrobiales bacterium]